MEITANTRHITPLWKKLLPAMLIMIVGTFAAGLFFSFMVGYSDNPDVQNSMFAGRGGWAIAWAISAFGVLIFVGVHIRKKQVCSFVFNDEKRSVRIGILPYWANGVREVEVPYNRVRFEETIEENIQAEEAPSIRFYDELQYLGSMTENHSVWIKYPKSFQKVKGKLARLKGSKE
jgi:hypothetical protein